MKNLSILSTVLLFNLIGSQLAAQVGINSSNLPPNASAMLDVSSSSKGVLLPQVSLTSLTDATTVANPAYGLIVFNTNGSLPTGKGYYYNNGTAALPVWTKLVTASAGWLTQGNSGTAAGDFLGTTDGKPLNFQLNGIPWGGFDYTSRNISIGIQALHNNFGNSIVAIGDSALYALSGGDGQNVAIGSRSGRSTTSGGTNTFLGFESGAQNTVGSYNIALGGFALRTNTAGHYNSAAGFHALSKNVDGDENAAFGDEALRENNAGSYNTAMGTLALISNTGGQFNAAVGQGALGANTTGSNNTGVGAGADVGANNLTNATAVGSAAMVGSSNSLVLGSINGVNGAIANTRVGIGTTTPYTYARLHVDMATNLTDGFMVSGNYDAAAVVPDLGSGSRLTYFPGKAAFRVGVANSPAVSNANTGFASFAAGNSSRAIGEVSTALGYITTASGIYSFSAGYFANATGAKAFAVGESVTASGANTVAFGINTDATGNSSMAIGNGTQASGNVSFATGLSTVARAFNSVAMGRYNDSVASSSLNAWVDTDPLLILGNGTSDAARSNAMVVLKNGNVGIGINNPGPNKLQVFGNTQTSSLQVSNGTVFSKVQSGSAAVGSSGTVQKTVTIPFPVSFSSVPRIVCTVVNDDPLQTNANDTWVVSVRNISTTQCVVNVVRVDSNAGWAALPHISWLAFTN